MATRNYTDSTSPCIDCNVNPRMQYAKRTHSYCKQCHAKRTRKWQLEHPEDYKASQERKREKQRHERALKPKKLPQRLQDIHDAIELARNGHQYCILWKGAKDKAGYGQMCLNGQSKRVTRVTLRMWMEQNGQTWDDSLDVLHSCDNPSCYNVNHLRQGTAKENIWDAIQRGRMTKHLGPKTWLRKLNEEQVREIRRRVAAGESQNSVAVSLKVSQPVVAQIVKGVTYKDIA